LPSQDGERALVTRLCKRVRLGRSLGETHWSEVSGRGPGPV
jgi:hypothetical protein